VNIIEHIPGKIPYKVMLQEKVKRPKRDVDPTRTHIDYPFKFIPEVN
jgi:hypothetical protein